MQNSESQKYRCPKCKAPAGSPCITLDGREAGKVHYHRPVPGPQNRAAFERAQRTLHTSPLRPTPSSPGIWVGSEYISRNESVPYGAWVCGCGESRVALSAEGVAEMNLAYAAHASCRQPRS